MPHGVSLNVSHGRVSVNAGSLRQLVALAYGIQRAMVEGGPDWSDRDEFNIIAKAGRTRVQAMRRVQEMLQTLLGDRFKLGVRRETMQIFRGTPWCRSRAVQKLKLAKRRRGNRPLRP